MLTHGSFTHLKFVYSSFVRRIACKDEWLPALHKLPILPEPPMELVEDMAQQLAVISEPKLSMLAVSNNASKLARVCTPELIVILRII